MNSEIKKIEAAPWLAEYAARRREATEQTLAELHEAVASLADEELAAAVFRVDPHDSGKEDIARFFLEELARRDVEKAYRVYKRWGSGAGA